jgi:hypothetical protein
MIDSNTVTVELIIQDSSASSEELQQIIRAIASQLEPQADSVSLVDVSPAELNRVVIPKGTQSSNILDIQINLDTLKSFGGWLYDRLVGMPTEVSFECEGIIFVFKGRNEQDRAAAIRDFERFLVAVRDKKEQQR